MAVTKFRLGGFVKIAHPDGMRFSKRAIVERLNEILEAENEDDYDAGMRVSKASVKVKQ